MESSVISLSTQLQNAREQVEQARKEMADQGSLAGLRLDEMVQALEDSSAKIAQQKSDE